MVKVNKMLLTQVNNRFIILCVVDSKLIRKEENSVGDIGARLRELRGERTIREVSEAVGVTEAAMSYYETGKRIPRPQIMIRIANYYGLPVGTIFFNEKLT